MNRHIIKQWAICVLLLSIQLVSIAVPGVAAHYQLAETGWQLPAERGHMPVHVEEDEQPAHEQLKTKKHRRKTRLYTSGVSRQYSFENYVFARFNHLAALSIFIAENKTGKYRFQHAFLPAYYSFLFRLTPF